MTNSLLPLCALSTPFVSDSGSTAVWTFLDDTTLQLQIDNTPLITAVLSNSQTWQVKMDTVNLCKEHPNRDVALMDLVQRYREEFSIRLESALAEALEWTGVFTIDKTLMGTPPKDSGLLAVRGQCVVPKWVRNPAESFKLMVQFNCFPRLTAPAERYLWVATPTGVYLQEFVNNHINALTATQIMIGRAVLEVLNRHRRQPILVQFITKSSPLPVV